MSNIELTFDVLKLSFIGTGLYFSYRAVTKSKSATTIKGYSAENADSDFLPEGILIYENVIDVPNPEKWGYTIFTTMSMHNPGETTSTTIFTFGLSLKMKSKMATMQQMADILPRQHARLLQQTFTSLSKVEDMKCTVGLLHADISLSNNPTGRCKQNEEYFGAKIALLLEWIDYFKWALAYLCPFWGCVACIHCRRTSAIIGIFVSLWLNICLQTWNYKRALLSASPSLSTVPPGERFALELSHLSEKPYERSRVIWLFLSVLITFTMFASQCLLSAASSYAIQHFRCHNILAEGVYYVVSFVFVTISNILIIPWLVKLERHSIECERLSSEIFKQFLACFSIYFARLIVLVLFKRTVWEIQDSMTALIAMHVIFHDLVVGMIADAMAKTTSFDSRIAKQRNSFAALDSSPMTEQDFGPLDSSGVSLLRECALSSFHVDGHFTDVTITLSIGATFASVVPTMVPLLVAYLWFKRDFIWDLLTSRCRRPVVSDDRTMEPWLPLVENVGIFAVILNVGMLYLYLVDESTGLASIAGMKEASGASIGLGLFVLEHALLFLQLFVFPHILSTFFGVASADLESDVLETYEDATEELESSNIQLIQYKQALEQLLACSDDTVSSELLDVLFAQYKDVSADSGSLTEIFKLAEILENVSWSMPPLAFTALAITPFVAVNVLSLPWWTSLILVGLVCSYYQHNLDEQSKKVANSAIEADPAIVKLAKQQLPKFLYDNDMQRCEWVNKMLKVVWGKLSEYGCNKVREKFTEAMGKTKLPSFVSNVTLSKLDMGTTPPTILGIRVLTGVPGAKQMEMDVDFTWNSLMDNEVSMTLFGAKVLRVGVNNFRISGTARMRMFPLIPAIPPFAFAHASFQTLPEVDFNLTFEKVDIMDFGLSSAIHGSVSALIRTALRLAMEQEVLYPKGILVELGDGTIPTDDNKKQETPQSIVCLNIVRCDNLPLQPSDRSHNPFIVAKLQDQSYATPHEVKVIQSSKSTAAAQSPAWIDASHTFLISETDEPISLFFEVWAKENAHGLFAVAEVDVREYSKGPVHKIHLELKASDEARTKLPTALLIVELLYLPLMALASAESHEKTAAAENRRLLHDETIDISDVKFLALDSLNDDDVDSSSAELNKSGSLEFDAGSVQSGAGIFADQQGLAASALALLQPQRKTQSPPTVRRTLSSEFGSESVVSGITDWSGGSSSKVSRGAKAGREARKASMEYLDEHMTGVYKQMHLGGGRSHDAWSRIAGLLTVSVICIKKLKSVKSMVSTAHYFSAYVTFMLEQTKLKTSIGKKQHTTEFDESLNFLVHNVDQDTLVAKVKYLSDLHIPTTLATFKFPLKQMKVNNIKANGGVKQMKSHHVWNESFEKDEHHVTGGLSCTLTFRAVAPL